MKLTNRPPALGRLAAVALAIAATFLYGGPAATPANAKSTPTPWTVVANPTPPAGINYVLKAVAAISESDVWAVGYAHGYTNSGYNEPLAEHWDGRRWSVVPIPNPAGLGDHQLNAVAGIASNDVWAVGEQNYVQNPAVAMHWNGASWSIVPTPVSANGGTTSLTGVAPIAANDVWTVGSLAFEHWNGANWAVVPSARLSTGFLPVPAAVAAVSTSDVWVVGTQFLPGGCSKCGGITNPLIEHWNGRQWSVVPSPASADTPLLNALAVVAANDIWAVGDSGPPTYSVIEHWDGAVWKIIPEANATCCDSFASISVRGAGDLWAVGSRAGTATRTSLTEHWNGASWSVVASPNPGTSRNELVSVSALPGGTVWAVGFTGCFSDSCGSPLILRLP